jgi:hypothetical protein
VIGRRWWLTLLLVPLASLQLFCLLYYGQERRSLSAYLDSVSNPSLAATEQIKQVVSSLKDKPAEGNESYFLVPVFRFLRPTPEQVIENGGDCADRSRLLVRLLQLRGISSSKWALYDAHGESVHAVIQADVESGKMVVDPLFGIWFPKPTGGYYAIRDLKRNPGILRQRIDELRAQGLKPGADSLASYNVDRYTYAHARTINWNKSAIMRYSYQLLHGLLGETADSLHRPAFVEEPPLMIFYGILLLEVGLFMTWLLVNWIGRLSLRGHLATTAQAGN